MYKFTPPTAHVGTSLDPLVEYAVRELGAICTSGWFEAQAEILLAQAEDTLAWRRRWATLADAAGWPCQGCSWMDWANAASDKRKQ